MQVKQFRIYRFGLNVNDSRDPTLFTNESTSFYLLYCACALSLNLCNIYLYNCFCRKILFKGKGNDYAAMPSWIANCPMMVSMTMKALRR
jgi:hypothetical protein